MCCDFPLSTRSTDFNNDYVIDGSEEYGDRSCPLSGDENFKRLNTPHRFELNWLPASATVRARALGHWRSAPGSLGVVTVFRPVVVSCVGGVL
jgi:hypothetical protein